MILADKMWAEEREVRSTKGCVPVARSKRNEDASNKWKIEIAQADAWFYATRKDKTALRHYKEKAALLMPLSGKVLGKRRQQWYDEQVELQRLTDEGSRPVGEFQKTKTQHEQTLFIDRSKFGDATTWRETLDREGHASQSSGSGALPQPSSGAQGSTYSSTDREGNASPEAKARTFPTPEVTTKLQAREFPDANCHSPPLVKVNRSWWKSASDKTVAIAKIGPSISRWNVEPKHAMLNPGYPSVYSCITMEPGQIHGPELYRNELLILFASDTGSFTDRCLFFCSCDEDKESGKVVMAKLRLHSNDGPIKLFRIFVCGMCRMNIARANMTYVYGCTVCNERICETCAESITTEPWMCMRYLCSKQQNLNHWCHGAAEESTRWKTPIGMVDMGPKITDWTWSWILKERIPYGDFIYHRSEGYQKGSREYDHLKARGVKRSSSPAECRNWRNAD